MIRYLLPWLSLWLLGCATLEHAPLYHQMDKADVALANQALADTLQTRPKGQSLTWFNAANRHSGSVTPLRTFRHANGHWCRDYREQLYIGQASQQWQDTACRSKEGHWLPLRS
ncbi:RT0821/Lpp0805 family surface protein [Aeromonas sp. MR7]|uniref:RT0821/Lpp0805 family surface protein n=1 Tax=Aeromonas sp. MR7 TaxID=2923419 RepID=UPI001F4A980E|nr:RT0821/Lpp0805 family surface protein [Aeromonas sp. MR7]MCH7347355.1 RT0821/Lpp0805 family surface protein [Aeromonas sp. MR7]